MSLSRPTTRPCETPGCTFPVDISKEKKRLYCCRECYHAHRKAVPVKQGAKVIQRASGY